jgi:hypothetical protein
MKHYLGICLVLVTLAGIAWFALRSCEQATDHTITSIREAFADALHLQPQVTINERVVLTQTAPIAELAVVTKEEVVSIEYTIHWQPALLPFEIPLTEKKLMAEAEYRLKAGFDLREPFSVAVNPVTHQIEARMPRAKILSVEQIGDLIYHGDDALLNHVTDTEREEILNKLNSTAHDLAEKSSLKADAENQVSQRLNQLLQHNGQSIQIEWTSPPKTEPSQVP